MVWSWLTDNGRHIICEEGIFFCGGAGERAEGRQGEEEEGIEIVNDSKLIVRISIIYNHFIVTITLIIHMYTVRYISLVI